MRKNIFSALVIFLAGVIVGYILTLQEPETEICKITEKEEDSCDIPQCDSGKCPIYKSQDVDGDNLSETVISVPYLMTKGVASIWVIDEGKVVLKTPARPGTNYSINNGINVSFVLEYEENGLRPKIFRVEKYRYKNGGFILEEEVDVVNEQEENLNYLKME